MLNIKLVKQKTGSSCGPACIAMIAGYYGQKVSWRKIMSVSHCKRDGMSSEDFIKALKRLKFDTAARDRHTWGDLRKYYKKRLPTIVAWMIDGAVGHFSVVVEVGDRHIVLADPDIGRRRKLTKSKFMRLWFDYDGEHFPTQHKHVHLRWAAIVRGVRL